MAKRKLIIKGKKNKSTLDSDKIENNYQLAHALTCLGTQKVERRYSKRIRLSGIGAVCPREQSLGYTHRTKVESRLGVHAQTTFDIGNAVHWWLQNTPEYFGDSRIGWWRCSACGKRVFGRPQKKNCSSCGALPQARVYDEYEMALDNPLVSGHPDMFLEVAHKVVRILEIKTISGDQYKLLKSPLENHVAQLLGYMHYLPQDPKMPITLDTSIGYILYISKQHVTDRLPLSAFSVTKDRLRIDSIERDVRSYTDYILNGGPLPPVLGKCMATNFECGRSRACASLTECREVFKNEEQARLSQCRTTRQNSTDLDG